MNVQTPQPYRWTTTGWRHQVPSSTPPPGSPCRLLAVALVQVGGGEFWGRTTGAKALFCLTAADTMLAGEKEKMPEELLQLEGRLVDEAMVGLDGTTGVGWGGQEVGDGRRRE